MGPISIERRVTLWGTHDAVIGSSGVGTTINVVANGTALLGFSVDGSGSRQDLDDSAVKVHADDVTVAGLRITDAMFGVLVSASRRARVVDNDITGREGAVGSLLGDPLRFWEVRDALIARNQVRQGRDCVLWYSSNNVFADNWIDGGRYGVHLMYSHDNRLEGNTIVRSDVGTFLMYSRGVMVSGNRYVDMSSAAGMGVGLKESGNLTIVDNVFVHNKTGLYIDTSPLTVGDTDEFARNQFILCDAAVVFHGRAEGNTFRQNVLRGNRVTVVTEGGGNALASVWEENYFDDYQGYDLDGDGTGDLAYETRSLAGDLTSRRPALGFFMGTPAMGIVDMAGKLVPLFAPQTIVRDESPALRSGES